MIDVSSYQGSIDWPAVYGDGVRVAIIRVGSGFREGAGQLYVDPAWQRNNEQARQAGLQVGFYYYAYPGLNTAAAEAEHFLTIVGSELRAGDVVPWLDFEISRGVPWPPFPQRANWKAAWFAQVDPHLNGALAGFYSYRSELDLMYPHLYPNRPVWISYPGSLVPYEQERCTVWQYGQGSVKGIAGAVDLDRRLKPTLPLIPSLT